jgi:hypothetical protein
MKKHIESNHFGLLKQFEKRKQTLPQDLHLIMSPIKWGPRVSPSVIYSFFSTTNKFKKDDAIQIGFLEVIMLFVIKGLMPKRTVKHKINTYLKCWPKPFAPTPWRTSKGVSQFVNKILALSSHVFPNYSINYSQFSPLSNYPVNAMVLM